VTRNILTHGASKDVSYNLVHCTDTLLGGDTFPYMITIKCKYKTCIPKVVNPGDFISVSLTLTYVHISGSQSAFSALAGVTGPHSRSCEYTRTASTPEDTRVADGPKRQGIVQVRTSANALLCRTCRHAACRVHVPFKSHIFLRKNMRCRSRTVDAARMQL